MRYTTLFIATGMVAHTDASSWEFWALGLLLITCYLFDTKEKVFGR